MVCMRLMKANTTCFAKKKKKLHISALTGHRQFLSNKSLRDVTQRAQHVSMVRFQHPPHVGLVLYTYAPNTSLVCRNQQAAYYEHTYIILAQHAGDVEITPLTRVALSV